MNTGQIRFFTYNDLRQLFKEAGLIISEIRGHAPLPVSEKFRALIKAAMPLDLISESFEAETSSSYFTLCAKKAATASKERRVTTGYTSERMVPGKSHWRTELQHQVRYRYFAPLTRDKTILDAGCGVGYGTYILARQGALVHGVDRDGDSITHGIARYGRRNVTFQRSDLLEMRDTARYERICTFGVLEQAECDRTLLQALCRVLEDDGIIILSSSNGEGNSSIHNPQPANPFQKRAYRLGELIDTLRSFFPWVAMFGQNDGFIWPLPEGNLPLGEMAGHFIAVCGKQPFPCLYEKLAGAWDESCTSVVIAAGDGLERTRQCLAAIRRYTYDPYNIIVVDCGSADGTVEYLKGQPDVTLVPAGKDEGLWRSWLRGAARSMRGDIVVMRNTVVVSHDWLGKMRQTLDDDEKTGVVSPRANIRGGAQMSTILYDNMDEFIRYAGAVEEESFGRFRRIETPDDYCLLFRRAAFDEAVSRLSEGSISTRRVCALVREWGYHIAEREDTFVHCMRH
jgi:2-polyprenyl-3-methyl-5-hydroxy-6-metoxy-1,4-benzoquinol methylase